MMDFAAPPRREQREAIVPMINVVFLLLIFFLMSAQLTPPAPVEITTPETGAEAADPGDGQRLFVDAGGTVHFGGRTGVGALELVPTASDGAPVLLVIADAGVDAARLARVLARLAAAGVAEVDLVVAAR